MSIETLRCNESGLDQWTDSVRFEVERDRLIQYAEATNDPIAALRKFR